MSEQEYARHTAQAWEQREGPLGDAQHSCHKQLDPKKEQWTHWVVVERLQHVSVAAIQKIYRHETLIAPQREPQHKAPQPDHDAQGHEGPRRTRYRAFVVD